MKIHIILLLFISMRVLANDSYYSVLDHTVDIPIVRIDNGVADNAKNPLSAYSHVSLLLGSNGEWSILSIEDSVFYVGDRRFNSIARYTPLENVVDIPRVTTSEGTAYSDVRLLLNSNGTWTILSIEDAEYTLDGNWDGFIGKPAGWMDYFVDARVSFSIAQVGSSTLEGSGYLYGVTANKYPAETNIKVKGYIDDDGRTVFIRLSYAETELRFRGRLSSDFSSISLAGSIDDSRILSIRKK